ncbi:MAG: GNAT family N-acetyltransferase [Nitrosopumilaceae archaeon]|jgi:N-acetylglutamate synthase-like GNAT family acetyltransferase
MTVLIRDASEEDIPQILKLLYELGRPEPVDEKEIKVFKNKINDYFSDPSKLIIVAEKESKILGLVSVILLQRLNHAKFEMYIPELVVTEEHRYYGIGKKLITYCIELAKKKNCYRIRLESGNQRTESHQFYKSLGFEQSSLSFNKNLL